MGQPMARHLAVEHPMVVFNRTATRMQPLADLKARIASSPAGVAAACRMIFLMLSDDDAVKSVVEGPGGLLESLQAGSVVVDHSTISPGITRALAARVAERGAEWLDAPVTGGDQGAHAATLTIMVGGRRQAFEQALPYCQLMGQRIVWVGAVGQGQTLKLVANMVSGINLMAAAEGLRLGLHLGLNLSDLVQVMQNSSAQSFELTKVLDRFGRHDYAPGFSVANRCKDLTLAADLAAESGFPADLGAFAKELYGRFAQAGFDQEDEASYLKHWEESE